MQKHHGQLWQSSWNWSLVVQPASSLFQVQLVYDLFPFFWGQFSELWQLILWLWPSHHVVNFFLLVEVSVSKRQFTRYDLTTGPWLCLMSALLLFGLLCFPLVLQVLISWIKFVLWLKFFHWQKEGRGHGEGQQWPYSPSPFQYYPSQTMDSVQSLSFTNGIFHRTRTGNVNWSCHEDSSETLNGRVILESEVDQRCDNENNNRERLWDWRRRKRSDN